MHRARPAFVLAVVAVAAAAGLSGGSGADRGVPSGLPGPPLEFKPAWLERARPLGDGAPSWARRVHARSLLVLRAAVDPHSGAVVAGAPPGWAYVWPRDAGAVALALAEAGFRPEARRIARFLLRLDLDAAARFYRDGEPVPGREAQGDAAGWVVVAARAAGLSARAPTVVWREPADYQEKEAGDYIGNAIASVGGPKTTLGVAFSSPRHGSETILREFGTARGLVRHAGDPGSGLDAAAAWAVEPFPHPRLFPTVRRTLLRLAAGAGRFGLLPSERWDGGEDPWTAPTAWTAWSLAALGERRAALRLMAALRRAATPAGLLPERVDAQTGVPRSTAPLAWSHAFAVLALRELWPDPP
jgi:glucoamylase